MLEDEIKFLTGLTNPNRNLNYNELSKLVNDSYRRTDNIRETMKETKLSFSEVWDMLGYKDYYDFT
jgi:hypothetical protein